LANFCSAEPTLRSPLSSESSSSELPSTSSTFSASTVKIASHDSSLFMKEASKVSGRVLFWYLISVVPNIDMSFLFVVWSVVRSGDIFSSGLLIVFSMS